MNIVCVLFPYLINGIIESILIFRQFIVLLKPQPESTLELASEKEFSDANWYGRDKLKYLLISLILNIPKDIFVIKNIHWLQSKKIYKIDKEVFLILLVTLIDEIYKIPFNLYFDFVIEKRHGFNKKSLQTFFSDTIKMMGLTVLFMTPLLYAAFAIIEKFKTFYLYLWVFLILFQIIMILIFPTFIAPLFNKFEKMEDSPLTEEIYKLANKIDFGIESLYVVDGSKRSGHSNAYFTGFGKLKKIVFFDTILPQLSQNEILAVLCHEFGHWKMNHIKKRIILMSSIMLGYLYAFNYTYNYTNESPAIKLLTFMYLIGPIGFISNIISNITSRCHEREADLFAVEMGYGKDLCTALQKISSENKGVLINDLWYSYANFSHPPLIERLEFIKSSIKKIESKNK